MILNVSSPSRVPLLFAVHKSRLNLQSGKIYWMQSDQGKSWAS